MAYNNTVPAELSLAAVMDTVLEEFVAEILPVKAFAMGVTGGRTLNELGSRTVRVPYISAITAASKTFDATAGDCYETDSTTLTYRDVVISNRLYQSWGITSQQSAENPVWNSVDFAKIKARKLAADTVATIMALVTPGNFPTEIAVGADSGFDVDMLLEVREQANTALMPKIGRSSILKDAYYTALLKDSQSVDVHGSTAARWDAKVPHLAGMDLYETTTGLDAATDTAAGIVTSGSGIIVAFAPIEPRPRIRQALGAFEIFTHPESGISLTYKVVVDPLCDAEIEIVEVNFGFNVGEADALIRLVVS